MTKYYRKYVLGSQRSRLAPLDEEIQEIKKLRLTGNSLMAIALKFGRDPHTIGMICYAEFAKTDIPDDPLPLIAAKLPAKTISERTNIPATLVSHYARRLPRQPSPSTVPLNREIKRQKRFTEAEHQEIINMWNDGSSIGSISQAVGRTWGAVRSFLWRHKDEWLRPSGGYSELL